MGALASRTIIARHRPGVTARLQFGVRHCGAEGGVAPRPRRRSQPALTLAEREEISRQLARGLSVRAISRVLRRAPSTISREVARNHGRTLYRAAPADRQAWSQSRRPQLCRLARYPALRRAVAAKLLRPWSPQQISGLASTDVSK